MAALPAHQPGKRRHIYRTMGRKEVLELCREHGYGERAAQILFFNVGCSARIVLQNMTYGRYNRATVLEVLGITD